MMHLGKHDESKKDIWEIVSKAQALGGYEHLQTNEKEIFIAALEDTQAAHDMGIVWRSMAQMHDVHLLLAYEHSLPWQVWDHIVCCKVKPKASFEACTVLDT